MAKVRNEICTDCDSEDGVWTHFQFAKRERGRQQSVRVRQKVKIKRFVKIRVFRHFSHRKFKK